MVVDKVVPIAEQVRADATIASAYIAADARRYAATTIAAALGGNGIVEPLSAENPRVLSTEVGGVTLSLVPGVGDDPA